MNLDDTLLMAYVDGELPAARLADIDQAIQASPELASRVALLRASVLPYQAAYANTPVEPVPASLKAFVDELARTGVAPATAAGVDASRQTTPSVGATIGTRAFDADESADDATPAKPELEPAMASAGNVTAIGAARRASAPRYPRVWLAAAFIAGAFFCGAALKGGHFIGPKVAPWLEAAAGYQELYTRDTVADVPGNVSVDARLLDEVRRDDHLPIAIPDLRNAGLTFKSIQRFRFRGRPLVQLVYLPERGDPIALCVIDAKQDQAMKTQHVYGMDVISWSRDKLAFALIGRNDAVDLAALHRQLADNPSSLRVD